MITLTGPVGRNTNGQSHDVATLQAALSHARPSATGHSGALWRGPVDGRASPDLHQAIRAFQRGHNIPPTDAVAPNDRTLLALGNALPMELRALRGVKGTALVFAAANQPGRAQQAIRDLREKTVLPRFASAPLAQFAERVHRDFGLILSPVRTETDHEGRFVQHLGFEDTRWIGRDGRIAPATPGAGSPLAPELVRAVMACLPGCPGLEAAGGTGGLVVRSTRRMRCLAGPRRTPDHARLARHQITLTHNEMADQLLIAAAPEIASRRAENELDSIEEALDGAHQTQSNQLARARKEAAKPASQRSQPPYPGMRRVAALSTSSAGLDFIKDEERFRPAPYNDPANNCTIGYGTLLHLGRCTASDHAAYPNGVTREQAGVMMLRDVRAAESDVKSLVGQAWATQGMFDAMTSLMYNVGISRSRGYRLWEKVNAGDYQGAATEFLDITRAGGVQLPGLVKRRRAESAMFLRGFTD